MKSPPAIARHPLWRRVATNWKLARLDRPDAVASDWIPATVPGAVQLDWARARGLPDIGFGQNVRAYDGLEDSHWLYRARVPSAQRVEGERMVFACEGVDYACEVRLGGRSVLRHEGLFSGFEVDVSDCPAGTELEVLVLPAPKKQGAAADRTQASQVCKPAVSYGWDWHPRLIPLGL